MLPLFSSLISSHMIPAQNSRLPFKSMLTPRVYRIPTLFFSIVIFNVISTTLIPQPKVQISFYSEHFLNGLPSTGQLRPSLYWARPSPHASFPNAGSKSYWYLGLNLIHTPDHLGYDRLWYYSLISRDRYKSRSVCLMCSRIEVFLIIVFPILLWKVFFENSFRMLYGLKPVQILTQVG